jgi:hypothetical protein
MLNANKEFSPDETLEVFVQVEGKQQITIVRILAAATVRDLLEEVVRLGLVEAAYRGELIALLEDVEAELRPNDNLHSAGVKNRSRLHFHRCRSIAVTVHFNGQSRQRSFGPSASIAKVFDWIVGSHGFGLTRTDAVEHVLQLSGTSTRPDEDVHVGTLTSAPVCEASFDLVPKRRVEG